MTNDEHHSKPSTCLVYWNRTTNHPDPPTTIDLVKRVHFLQEVAVIEHYDGDDEAQTTIIPYDRIAFIQRVTV